MNKIPESFYLDDDVVSLSRALLGKYLFTCFDGVVTGGRITETEAYRGPEDRACHAYNNLRTARTDVLFRRGGVCYVYLCYGIHHLLNVVTNHEGIPHAILIRAIEPLVGVSTMMKRRKKTKLDITLTSGPGSLAQALGIDRKLNGISLLSDTIWVEDRKETPSSEKILVGPRVGIDYAGEDAFLPWRFRLMA